MFFDTPSTAAILGSIITLLILDFLAVVLRFYSRRKLRQPYLCDDWFIIAGFISVLGLVSILFYGLGTRSLGERWVTSATPDGTPLATADPTGRRIDITVKLEYASLLIFTAANGLVKISVLFFYRRIFVIDSHWRNLRNIFMCIMIALITMWAVSYVLVFLFLCGTHWEALFGEEIPGYCVDTMAVGYSCSISDFISDALIIMVPFPFVLRLRLSRYRKLAVLSVFTLGILASGASLVRLCWMVWNKKQGFGPQTDAELMITTELYWMTLEMTLGILAACLPTLRGLINKKLTDSFIASFKGLLSLGSDSSFRSTPNSVVTPASSKSPQAPPDSSFLTVDSAGSISSKIKA